MIYRDFCGKKLSMLGFGAMRLPTDNDGNIDVSETEKMVDTAISAGVNYFDTAWPYHLGQSETVIGSILKKYPRESYYLATKYPGHQTADSYDPKGLFETQLKKCGVDYFDFYLLHNVCENSLPTYKDEKWGIIDYFIEQKKQGRIRHLGFSTHGGVEMIKEFLDDYGEHMEFCQIQFNYLDDTLQNAGAKYKLLTERKIPVWVMEPVRGGKLASLGEETEEKLHRLRPGASPASFAFRWLQSYPNVSVVLSGMSNMEQLLDNIATFESENLLLPPERDFIAYIAEKMKDSLPCTACRYCVDVCPMELDIPMLISVYNEIRFQASVVTGMRLEALEDDRLPSACISCGACSNICPQKIDVPTALADLSQRYAKMPKWSDICRKRAAAQK